MSFDEGRAKLWEARDISEDTSNRLYKLHVAFGNVGLTKPSRDMRDVSSILAKVKSLIKEAEAEMARAYYDKENNEQA
ncbi:hypothetical protein LCGC14_2108640 [marine sediment metagenome]|uniref:Uncharacterized protein n=1 Tax=marine sediment metagenome TaxID=412755 RepID=A0A0F9GKX2_9ZZZZ